MCTPMKLQPKRYYLIQGRKIQYYEPAKNPVLKKTEDRREKQKE